MCEKIPFHPEALAVTSDLVEWAEMFRAMSLALQREQTVEIRRVINLTNMVRKMAGQTTRVDRPSIKPEMIEE